MTTANASADEPKKRKPPDGERIIDAVIWIGIWDILKHQYGYDSDTAARILKQQFGEQRMPRNLLPSEVEQIARNIAILDQRHLPPSETTE